MDWIVPTVMLGAATATATTFDDNIYLTMFFSKTNRTATLSWVSLSASPGWWASA